MHSQIWDTDAYFGIFDGYDKCVAKLAQQVMPMETRREIKADWCQLSFNNLKDL